MIQTGHYNLAVKQLGLLSLFLLITSSGLQSQKDPLKAGNAAFEEDQYRVALIYYNQIEKINKSAPILYKRGVCYYEVNQLDRAIADFRQAWEYGYKKPDVDYYMGLIEHHRGNFHQAADFYKNYLRETPLDQGDRRRVRKLIKQCGRAIDLSYRRPIAIIERGPPEVNSAYDEINMLESPSIAGKYYYTSNKPNTSTTMAASDYDIYFIQQDTSGWNDPNRLPYAINKSKEDILIGFTPDAEGIYFYRGEIFEGQFFLNSSNSKSGNSQSIQLDQSFNLQSSDAYLFDNHLIIFSARRSEGYGGLDLYYSKLENEVWSKPKNLGPRINSKGDEISPFLSQDGTELYFSSNREDGIGEYDVFFSSYLYESNQWDHAENLGIPINSPGNDDHFRLTSDGLQAHFSSDRKSAHGGRDIFIARFKSPRGQQEYTTDYIPFADYTIDRTEIFAIDTSSQLEQELAEASEVILTEPIDSAYDMPTDSGSMTSDSNLPVQDIAIVNKESQDSVLGIEPSITTEESTTIPDIPVQQLSNPSTPSNTLSPIIHQLPALYYSSSNDVLQPTNIKTLVKLSKLLKTNPSLKLELQCHSSEDGILEFKLFSSIKIAEKVKRELGVMGIEKNRIIVKGFADNYPIALSEKIGGDPIIADKYNNRIEFKFFNYDNSKMQIESVSADIPSHIADNTYELYRALSDQSIHYKIQIAIVSQMYRGMALDLFNDATVERDPQTGLYLYSVGFYDNYTEAQQIKRDIENLGITDARILPYYDGRILDEDQLVYYINQYPDLRNFMNYGG